MLISHAPSSVVINADDCHNDVDDDDNVDVHESGRESFSLGAIQCRTAYGLLTVLRMDKMRVQVFLKQHGVH